MKNLKMLAVALAVTAGLAGCGEQEVTLSNVELDLSECQTVFTKDSAFSSEGLKVVATYSDGTSEYLEFETSTPDMSTVGTKEVTTTFQIEGEEQEFSYDIDVSYWSEEDIAVFDNSDLLINELIEMAESHFELPFLPGMKTETVTDKEGNVTDWYIKLENADEATVNRYANMLLAFDEEVSLGQEMTGYFNYQMPDSVPEGAAEYANVVSNVKVVSMIAYYEANNRMFRFCDNDEYIVVGLDENNNMIVKAREVSNYTNDELIGAPADGLYWVLDEDTMNEIQSYFSNGKKGIAEFSQCSTRVINFPEMPSALGGNNSLVYDAKLVNPFSTNLDQYDFSVGFQFGDATASERTAFVNSLKASGFERVDQFEAGAEDPYLVEVFELEDMYKGYFKVNVSELIDDDFDLFVVNMNYKQPELEMSLAEHAIYEYVFRKLGIGFDELTVGNKNELYVTDYRKVATGDALSLLKACCALNGLEARVDKIAVSAGWASDTMAAIEYEVEGYTVDLFCMEKMCEDGYKHPVYDAVATKIVADMTLEEFADDCAAALGLEFNETDRGSGIYYAEDNYWADSGFNYQYLSLVLEQIYAPDLPEYLEEGIMAFNPPAMELENGASRAINTFVTPNGKYELVVDGYEVAGGVMFEFYAREYVEDVLTELSAEQVAKDYSMKLFGVDDEIEFYEDPFLAGFDAYIGGVSASYLTPANEVTVSLLRDTFTRAVSHLPTYATLVQQPNYNSQSIYGLAVVGNNYEVIVEIDLFIEDARQISPMYAGYYVIYVQFVIYDNI